jgi:hypothetical protein
LFNALIPLRAVLETALVDEIVDKNPLKGPFCPVYVSQNLKNEIFEEKILINQIVNLASPRGFECQSDPFSDTSATTKDN